MLVDTAVIVVGARPTGLMLAGERQTVPGGQSRGGGVNSRTAEVLAMRGLIDGVADQASPRTNVGWSWEAPSPLTPCPQVLTGSLLGLPRLPAQRHFQESGRTPVPHQMSTGS